MICLVDIAKFLLTFFGIHRFGDDQNGVYLASTRPIARFGLALEPWVSKMGGAEQLDYPSSGSSTGPTSSRCRRGGISSCF